MLAAERVAESRPELLVLPARIGHDPIEIVEHARDHEIGVTLRGGQPVVDGEVVFAREVRDDRVAVADRLAVVDDKGSWPRGAAEASKMCWCVKGTPANLRNANTLRP